MRLPSFMKHCAQENMNVILNQTLDYQWCTLMIVYGMFHVPMSAKIIVHSSKMSNFNQMQWTIFHLFHSALLEFMTAPNESLQRRVYNVTAMSFTPEELVNKLYKYVPDLHVSYRPDTRQNIGKMDLNWKVSLNLVIAWIFKRKFLINFSRCMATSVWWLRSTSWLAMESKIWFGQIGRANGQRCTRKSYRQMTNFPVPGKSNAMLSPNEMNGILDKLKILNCVVKYANQCNWE